MLSSVKTMASSRFGNDEPDALRNDNLRSKKTGDSTKFLYYQYILDKFHFLKSPKTFRVIITIIL
jgi:hypothetical protein